MLIRTKIIATVGPASGSVEVIRLLAEAGADVFRVNFSHGDNEQRAGFLWDIRTVEDQLGRPLAVIADLCGPKIRTGPIVGGSVLLAEGQKITIQRAAVEGTVERVSTTLGELVDAAVVGETILLDDGKLRLTVIESHAPERIVCRVDVGGILASGKGVNLPHTDLKLSALTEKDRADVAWIVRRDFDYVALSFVRRPQDIEELRELLTDGSCGARIIAKIEKPQAMAQIEAIVDAADAVMVARGDLGVEMALPAVPVAQKRIARLCHRAGKVCIIATQMLESMTACPTPTRAEVSDVANAVLDYADAVMLSGETAVGRYPVQAVKVMNDIVSDIQAYHDENLPADRVDCRAARTVTAIAAAVREIIDVEDIAAVATYTATGTTARILAKSRLVRPILAVSHDVATVRRMCLYYGVEAVQTDEAEHTRDLLAHVSGIMVDMGIAQVGQKIVVVSGRPMGQAGATNTIVVHTI